MFSKLKPLSVLLTVFLAATSSFAADTVQELSADLSTQLEVLVLKNLSVSERLDLALKTQRRAETQMAKFIETGKVEQKDIYNPKSHASYVLNSIYALDKLTLIKVDPATGKAIDTSCNMASVVHSVANSNAEGEELAMVGPDKQVQNIIKLVCQP